MNYYLEETKTEVTRPSHNKFSPSESFHAWVIFKHHTAIPEKCNTTKNNIEGVE